MAKLNTDDVHTKLRGGSSVVELDFKTTFPNQKQVHVVVTPKLRGDNVATLTKPDDPTKKTAEATLKFVSLYPGVLPSEVAWNITLKANFETKVLSASGKGDSKEDYSFAENIAAW